jgi:hypothetical protein
MLGGEAFGLRAAPGFVGRAAHIRAAGTVSRLRLSWLSGDPTFEQSVPKRRAGRLLADNLQAHADCPDSLGQAHLQPEPQAEARLSLWHRRWPGSCGRSPRHAPQALFRGWHSTSGWWLAQV